MIRVLVVDDHALIRETLAAIISAEPDLAVVASACDGDEAVLLTRRLRPDVVLMDLSMPGLDGFAATRQIKERVPDVSVLALTMLFQRAYVDAARLSGADGFLRKDVAVAELLRTIRAIAGGPPIAPDSPKAPWSPW